MFDLVGGLPVHILVLHAVVVLGPIAGLTAVAYAARPGWRRVLHWPLLALSAVVGVAAFVTKESGEALEHRLKGTVDAAQRALIETHAGIADKTGGFGVIFMVVTLVAVWFVIPGVREGRFGKGIQAAAAVIIALMSVALVVLVFLAGHTGATAAWAHV